MNWLDLIFLLIVGVSAVMGLKIGMIRATFTFLAIFVGIILGAQLSDNIAGLLSGVNANSTVALVLSYAIIISLSLVTAAIASEVVRKSIDILAMGWADKLAGVALGVVAGAVIPAAVIMGMAYLTYGSEVGDRVATKILDSTLDPEKSKNRLQDGLRGSAMVGGLVDAVEIIPASTMWFIPSKFTTGLGAVGQHRASSGN